MKYIYVISLFLILVRNIYCENGISITNYTLSFFQNLKTVPCRKDSDCPDYSNICDKDNGYCSFYMFCHKYDKCLKLSLKEFDVEYYYQWPYYKTESYDIKNKNMQSCNINIKNDIKKENKNINVDKLGSIDYDKDNWGIFEDCKYLPTCVGADSDTVCYSGKCNKKEDMCEIDNDKPGYVCTLRRDEDELFASVKCLLMNHEKCSKHSDCLSNVCDSNVKICVTKDSKLYNLDILVNFFNKYWYFIFGTFLLILITICTTPHLYVKMKKPKKIVLAKMDY